MVLRIVVTGSQGQVASSMQALAAGMGVNVIAIGRPDIDLADPSSVLPALAAARPDCIVSAAAYTQVDRAEQEPELAYRVNANGAGAVAQAAGQLGVPVLHLSTDYVFAGDHHAPYCETDPTGPMSIYGATKLAGEHQVAEATPNHAIFRTAWVYSSVGSNFLKTMLRLGDSRDELQVVADQRGCPTSAEDIARALILAARQLVDSDDPALRGIFHLTASGEASWAEFAAEIFNQAGSHGRKPVRVTPISSDQYPSAVKRPANSRLSADKLRTVYGLQLPDWRLSTARTVAALLA